MNKLFYCIIAVVAYILGTIFPFNRLLPSIDPQHSALSAYELYDLVVNIVLAFLTLLTVCVALFKEDIVSIWRKPKLHVGQSSLIFSEDLIDGSNTTAKEARKYTISFRLENKKDIVARNIKVRLNQITFKNHQANIENNLTIKDQVINIQGEGFLSRFNPIMIDIITLEKIQHPQDNQAQASRQPEQAQQHSTQQESQADQHQIQPAERRPDVYRFKIGDNEIPNDYHNGELEIQFTILCSESSSICKTISLKWDKIWECRLHDMRQNNHLSANFLENK